VILLPLEMRGSPTRPTTYPTAAQGHEDAFPRPRLSVRCRFSQGTFAGTLGNGRDAPLAGTHFLARASAA
jgi:hypothetical protein